MTERAPWFDYLEVPSRTLGYKATIAQARAVARKVVKTSGSDPYTWLKPGRFYVKDEPRKAHGLEALCIPMERDRFRFVVFTSDGDHPQRHAFLICHEVAHTFFYLRANGQRPRRSMLASEWEEAFCDAFAEAVTGTTAQQVGLAKKSAAHLADSSRAIA